MNQPLINQHIQNIAKKNDFFIKTLLKPALPVEEVRLKNGKIGFLYPQIIRDENDYSVMRFLDKNDLTSPDDERMDTCWEEVSVYSKEDYELINHDTAGIFAAACSGWRKYKDGYSYSEVFEDFVLVGLSVIANMFGYNGIRDVSIAYRDNQTISMIISELDEMVASVSEVSENLYRMESLTQGDYYHVYVNEELLNGKNHEAYYGSTLFEYSMLDGQLYFNGIGNRFRFGHKKEKLNLPFNGKWPMPITYKTDEGKEMTGWLSIYRYLRSNCCAGGLSIAIINGMEPVKEDENEIFPDFDRNQAFKRAKSRNVNLFNSNRYQFGRNDIKTTFDKYVGVDKPLNGDIVVGDFAGSSEVVIF